MQRHGAWKSAFRPAWVSRFTAHYSLLYPCFKTAFCYGVVSGCFVLEGLSFFPDPAESRSKTLLERSKVRAKSMQKLLGHNAALRGRSLLRLRKNPPEWRETPIPERSLAVLDSAEMPQNFTLEVPSLPWFLLA